MDQSKVNNNQGEYGPYVRNIFNYNSPIENEDRVFHFTEYDASKGQCILGPNIDMYAHYSEHIRPQPLYEESSEDEQLRRRDPSRVRRRLFFDFSDAEDSSDEGFGTIDRNDDQPLDYEYWFPEENHQEPMRINEVEVVSKVRRDSTESRVGKRSKTKAAYKAVRKFFRNIGWSSKRLFLQKAVDVSNKPAFLMKCPKCFRPMRFRMTRSNRGNGFNHNMLSLKRHVYFYHKENVQ